MKKDKPTKIKESETVELFDEEMLDQRLEGQAAHELVKRRAPLSGKKSIDTKPLTLPTPETPSQTSQNQQKHSRAEDPHAARSLAVEGDALNAAESARSGIPIDGRPEQRNKRISKLQKVLLGGAGLILLAGLGVGLYLFLRPSPALPMQFPDMPLTDAAAPIPKGLTFPDGQTFELAQGSLASGRWTPQGSEWLAGSEEPRWLALPWTKQLESAIRAFKTDDPIGLRMSNGDTLDYHFQWLQEVQVQDMATFHKNSNELLIVLSKDEGNSRLILVAIP